MNSLITTQQFYDLIYNSPALRKLWNEKLNSDEVVDILNSVPDEDYEKYIKIPFLKILHGQIDLLKIHQELSQNYNMELTNDHIELIFEYIAHYLFCKNLTLLFEVNNIQGIVKENLKFKENKEKIQNEIGSIVQKLKGVTIPFDELKINILKNHRITLETELSRIENEYDILSRIETRGQNTLQLLNVKKRRPNCEHLDYFIFSLHSFGKLYYTENYWAQIIQPTLIYMAKKFPDFLDLNDFKDIDKIKSRMKHLKIKNNKSRGGNSENN